MSSSREYPKSLLVCTFARWILPSAFTTSIASGAASRSWAKSSSARRAGIPSLGIGNPQDEDGAWIGALDPDKAAVRLHGDAAERETKAAPGATRRGSLPFELHEWIEDRFAE